MAQVIPDKPGFGSWSGCIYLFAPYGYDHSTVWFAWSETTHPFVSHVPEQFIRVVRTNSILWSGPIKFLSPDQLTFSGPGREVFGPHHYFLVLSVIFWSRPVAVLVGPFSGWDRSIMYLVKYSTMTM